MLVAKECMSSGVVHGGSQYPELVGEADLLTLTVGNLLEQALEAVVEVVVSVVHVVFLVPCTAEPSRKRQAGMLSMTREW